MQIVSFFKDFYKGIAVGILLIPVVFFFNIFLNDFITENRSDDITIIIIQFSILAFGLTFLLYIIFLSEYYTQIYSPAPNTVHKDTSRVKTIIKIILAVYFSLIIIWSISIFSILHFSLADLDLKIVYILILPPLTFFTMTFAFSKMNSFQDQFSSIK